MPQNPLTDRSSETSDSIEIPTQADDGAKWKWVVGICMLLVVAVGLVFGQTVGHNFVNYDDDTFIVQNGIVNQGLTREGIVWFWVVFLEDPTHPKSTGNWLPFTAILMSDGTPAALTTKPLR